MKSFDKERPVNNLPDYYEKSKSSNNYKLLEIEKVSVDTLDNDIKDLLEMLEIDNAVGKTLDMYGEMVNQQRGLATDDQYRFMIRSKIMQNLSTGDYGSVLKALYMTFGCDPADISIAQSEQPCVVAVKKVPIEIISKAGLNVRQTVQLIQRLIPVGITIETFNFTGTFEFSASENDMETDGKIKGFTDTEDNITVSSATGGYLGEIYDNDDEDLPI